MQLSQIATLGLVGLSMANPFHQKRTAIAISADLDALRTELTGFHDAIDAFEGTISDDEAQEFMATYISLQAGLTKATTDVKLTGRLSGSDSKTIGGVVHDLTTEVVDLLHDAVDEQSAVEKAGYSSKICDGLSTFQDGTDGLLESLLKTIDAALVTHVTDLQTTADKAFGSAIKSYGC